MAYNFPGTTNNRQDKTTPSAAQSLPLSFGLRFKADAFSANQGLMWVFAGASSSTNYLRFFINTTPRISWSLRGSTTGDQMNVLSTIAPGAGTWCHVLGTATATDLVLHINNGTTTEKVTVSGTVSVPSTTMDTMRFGTGQNTALNQTYAGDIADAGIWDVVLTDAEAATYVDSMGSASLIRPASLISEVSAVGGTFIDLRDSGGFSETGAGSAAVHPRVIYPSAQILQFPSAAAPSVSAAVAGTATANITEVDLRAGGKIITLTLTGDTWIA